MKPPTATKVKLLTFLLLVAALMATACGSSATGLQGDTASTTAAGSAVEAEPAPTQASAGIEPTISTPVVAAEPAGEDEDPDGSQIALATEEPGAQADESEPQDKEPAAPAVLVDTVGSGGAHGQFNGAIVTMGSTTAINADLDSFIAGVPELDDDGHNWLVSTVAIEGLVQRVDATFRRSDFQLVAPDGHSYEVDTLFDAAGDETSAIDTDGRTYRETRLAFETEELIETTDGWILTVGTDAIPLLLPVNGAPFAPSYPLALPDGQQSTWNGDDNCPDGTVFETRIDRAIVLTEHLGWEHRLSGQPVTRVPANERIVAIDITITGFADVESGNCGNFGFRRDFLLLVDDRPVQPFAESSPDIEGIVSDTARFAFQIPADASTLALVLGDDEQELGSWDVSFPAAVGEPEADLVPSGDAAAGLGGPLGERPVELTSSELASGGATGEIIQLEVAVGTTFSTNADIASFITNTPEIDAEGRTWVVTEFELEGIVDEYWRFADDEVILVDPSGRPHSAKDVYDRAGETQTAVVDGVEFHALRAAFETDGLVTDVAGWTLQLDLEEALPLVLPLAGEAENPWPVTLSDGQTETLTYTFSACSDGAVIDARIAAARIDIEGPSRAGSPINEVKRVDPEGRFIVIDVELLNSSAPNQSSLCGRLRSWPEFRLDVDGRGIAAFRYPKPTIEPGETVTLTLNFRVPKESQLVTLFGGDNQPIVSWEIKDSREVLQDFEAQAINERTVITLDETLLFAFGESTLQQSATGPLTRAASVINSQSTGEVTVVGHTDSIGDEASNQALSLARAEAVAAALAEAGVDESRLAISGDGEASPIAANTNDDGSDNPAGRAENRRVEISFESGS